MTGTYAIKCLAISDVIHGSLNLFTISGENGQSHGFAKQLKQIIKNELKINKSMKPALDNPSFQLFIREWIHFYNTQRASIGFPNYSKIPIEVHKSGLSEIKP